MLYLKKLSPNDDNQIYNMLQEIESNDNGFHNKVKGMTLESFKTWLQNEYEVDNGKLEDWMVPQSSYWLYDGDTPLGYGRIRHFLNANLQKTSGHIGYAIAKSKRGNGYGNQILSLLLDECKKLSINQVQVGANVTNILSNKVIQYNGGVLINKSNGKCFYRIDIT